MEYRFDELVERRGTGSLKWDVEEQELPMWVADMDFPTAPEIRESLEKRAAHGIFGYAVVTPEWYGAVSGWWERRHQFKLEEDWLVFCTGVVPAISSIVRKLTTPGENVLVQTPVYNIFFNSVLNNGRNVLENRLLYDGEVWKMDFEDLERKLSEPQTSLMILCNPHNPVGRLWDRETLARIGELCAKYHVTVLSDEIHCDIVEPGYQYIPFASVSELCRENSITCIAPTKAFNLAGLQTAAVAVPNPFLRHKVWRALNTDEVAEPNAFAVDAAVAAFTGGEPWLDSLRAYLWENRRAAEAFIRDRIPGIKAVGAHATYLMWLDCTQLSDSGEALAEFIRRETGLYLCAGEEYRSQGAFLRFNLACPRTRLEAGLKRLQAGIEKFRTETGNRNMESVIIK
ncbi:MAG: pyridoxal phosphate-dependent aminotransferase [Roseburia sp.]|nr:pyridoxal phosphate-dependent aminotransferase [Roseburia sp.]